MRQWKYILKGHQPVPCTDPLEWARWFETAERHVGNTMVGEIQISTVFLGIDHGFGLSPQPILFETMIFGGAHDGEQRRYTTWKSAENGHQEVVAMVQQDLDMLRKPLKPKSTRRRIVLEE